MSSKELSERIEELRRRDPKLSVTFNPERSAIAMLRGQLSAPVDAAILRAGPAGPFERTREFLRENRVLLGDVDVAAELVEEKASTNRRGMTHVMFQQMHGPARLLGGAVSVHYAADGSAYQLKSSLASAIDLPKEPTIDADRAVEIAAEHAGQGYTRFAGRDPVLLVVDARTVHMEEGPRYYLCWQVSLVTPVGAQGPNWIYMVDAIHGTVLLRYPAEKTQTGTGYYSQGSALNADKSGSMPILRDAVTSSTWPVTTRPVIHTYDDNGSTNLTLTNYSQDSDGVWGDVIPAQRVDDQRPEVDIHRFAGYVLDYYYQTHKHNGWDGGGADLRIHAHNGEYAEQRVLGLQPATDLHRRR